MLKESLQTHLLRCCSSSKLQQRGVNKSQSVAIIVLGIFLLAKILPARDYPTSIATSIAAFVERVRNNHSNFEAQVLQFFILNQ